jgi:hypothetical protein
MLAKREEELANERYRLLSTKKDIDEALKINEIRLEEIQRLKATKASEDKQDSEDKQEPKE